EERRRAVAPLLDVGRVGGAHEHRPHLLAGCAQGSGRDPQRDRVERPRGHRERSARVSATVPLSSTWAAHAGGMTTVVSGNSSTAGPCAVKPAAGSPVKTLVPSVSPSKRASRVVSEG